MELTVPAYTRCRFIIAWVGQCKAAGIGGFCEQHDGIKCVSCKAQATHDCDHTGQFVCGAPLCDDCHGCVDHSRSAGSWGFMNHYHKRKSEPTRAELDKEAENLRVESAALGVGPDPA